MKNRKLWYEFPLSYAFYIYLYIYILISLLFCIIFCLLTSSVRCRRRRGSLCISINFINNSISQKIIWTAPKENKKVSTPGSGGDGWRGGGIVGEGSGERRKTEVGIGLEVCAIPGFFRTQRKLHECISIAIFIIFIKEF